VAEKRVEYVEIIDDVRRKVVVDFRREEIRRCFIWDGKSFVPTVSAAEIAVIGDV